MLEQYKRSAPYLFVSFIFHDERLGVRWHSCFVNKAGAKVELIMGEIQHGIHSHLRHMAHIGRALVHLKKTQIAFLPNVVIS